MSPGLFNMLPINAQFGLAFGLGSALLCVAGIALYIIHRQTVKVEREIIVCTTPERYRLPRRLRAEPLSEEIELQHRRRVFY